MTKELLKGNEAFAEAAVRAGVEGFFGYPITPSTEFLEYMAKRMPTVGRAFVQAESEVAAINMVYGAACAGVRAMTATSSPGRPFAAFRMASMASGLLLSIAMMARDAPTARTASCSPTTRRPFGIPGR